MNEVEQRDMARRLCELSERFDFDLALELVQMRPTKPQELLDMHAKMERRQEERTRSLKRLHRALIEDYG